MEKQCGKSEIEMDVDCADVRLANEDDEDGIDMLQDPFVFDINVEKQCNNIFFNPCR